MIERLPITHVAVRFQEKVYSLPEPNRHHDVIILIAKETGVSYVDSKGEDQGFLDSSGRYLNRKQALLNARLHNQIKGTIIHNELYSENLW
jgi:hypothetical protein